MSNVLSIVSSNLPNKVKTKQLEKMIDSQMVTIANVAISMGYTKQRDAFVISHMELVRPISINKVNIRDELKRNGYCNPAKYESMEAPRSVIMAIINTLSKEEYMRRYRNAGIE